ncbi:MAG: rod shape-determining protein MreC [Bacilli bacterium]
MYKKRRNSDENLLYILLLVFILTIIFTGLSNTLRDSFNVIKGSITTKNKTIEVTDLSLKTYIYNLEKEMDEMSNLLKLNKNEKYKCVNANVINRNPSFWYESVTINKGSLDNIEKDNIVINNIGVIGKINKVYNNSSEVSFITNVNSKNKTTVAIKYNDEIVYGTISKYDYNKKELIISEITTNIEYIDNMEVFSLDLNNNNLSGLLIGKVIKIEKDKNNLSKIAVVKPVVDFNSIKYVCVMVK